jgi:hypothetical protein
MSQAVPSSISPADEAAVAEGVADDERQQHEGPCDQRHRFALGGQQPGLGVGVGVGLGEAVAVGVLVAVSVTVGVGVGVVVDPCACA